MLEPDEVVVSLDCTGSGAKERRAGLITSLEEVPLS